jgi:CheY-like chemotaxis protein/two-component sensor histidine kinase
LVGVLGSRVSEPDARKIVHHIEDAVTSMEGLLNAILDISRLDAGIEHPQISPVAIRNLWNQLERNFATTAASHALQLRLRPSNIWIASDETLLLRILNNLVGNAIRYTESGGVLVACRKRAGHALIEVLDSGIGIPVDRQEEIFQEFVQLHNPHRDRTMGLGLGLSIVRRTVKLLGHTLELRSVPGHGSRFRITVPCVDLPQSNFVGATFERQVDVDGLFVLFVDDEQSVRFATQALLIDWGCSVIAVSNSQEAVNELAKHMRLPDALVLDYRLPDETGVQLARRLHQASQTHIPTLIITGDVTAGPLMDIQQSGLSVQHKPMNPTRLKEWLGQIKSALADCDCIDP